MVSNGYLVSGHDGMRIAEIALHFQKQMQQHGAVLDTWLLTLWPSYYVGCKQFGLLCICRHGSTACFLELRLTSCMCLVGPLAAL